MASAQLSAVGKHVLCDKIMQELNSEGNSVQIKCGSMTFLSNKCYLSAASPRFAEIFHANKDIQAILIPDVKAQVFQQLLHYVYYAKLDNLNMELASELYMAASEYQVQPLKSLCGSYMIRNFDEKTICKVLDAVAKCSSNSPEDQRLVIALKKFVNNNKEFLSTSTWTSFRTQFPEVAELISRFN